MQRRDFVNGGIAAVASGWLPVSAFAAVKREVTWAPYQNLEAVARFGSQRVTWTNTGCPRAEEREAQGLPDYVALRDGGIRAIYDQWYGSRTTNWSLAILVAKGALSAGD